MPDEFQRFFFESSPRHTGALQGIGVVRAAVCGISQGKLPELLAFLPCISMLPVIPVRTVTTVQLACKLGDACSSEAGRLMQ